MNEFYVKLVGILKFVKIREFSEFIKFINFNAQCMGGGMPFHRYLDDTVFRPTFTLSFAGQWSWLTSGGRCLACCPCSVNRAAAGQRQPAWAAVINWP